MGKKKTNLLPALFSSSRNRAETGQQQQQQPWQWASCNHPKTLSFRADGGSNDNGNNAMFKTLNSVFFDQSISNVDGEIGLDHSPEASWFTSTSESGSHSTEYSEDLFEGSLEVLVRGARSDRLFFEPGGDTSSILGPHGADGLFPPFKESVVLAMESQNPYMDFRRSMEEMVESNGIKDWECLEELLAWYLRMNGMKNHGFIIEAFIDLLLNITSSNQIQSEDSHKNINVTSFSSAASSFSDDTDPSLKGVEITEEEEKTMTTITMS